MRYSTPRSFQRLLAVLTAGVALALVVGPAAALRAETAAEPAAKALPLTHKFGKSKDAEKNPHVLTLKNTSDAPITVTAQVLLSVAFHATDKARNLPAQTIAPGKSWKIDDLATDDKITVKADGYAPLELTVPAAKAKKEKK